MEERAGIVGHARIRVAELRIVPADRIEHHQTVGREVANMVVQRHAGVALIARDGQVLHVFVERRASGLAKINMLTIRCAQVVPHFEYVATMMSSERGWNPAQRALSNTRVGTSCRAGRTRFGIDDPRSASCENTSEGRPAIGKPAPGLTLRTRDLRKPDQTGAPPSNAQQPAARPRNSGIIARCCWPMLPTVEPATRRSGIDPPARIHPSPELCEMAPRVEKDVRNRTANFGRGSEHANVGAVVEDGADAVEHSVHGSREP